jgi:hypothetical protein
MISRFFPLNREFFSILTSANAKFLGKSNGYDNSRGARTGIYVGLIGNFTA